MKLFSKPLVVGVALILASTVSAGTLYWQVDDNSGDVYARLLVEDQDTHSVVLGESDPYKKAPTGIQQTDISDYDNGQYLFYVELVNFADGSITQGYKWGYGDLVSSGYVSFGATDIPTARANAAALGNFANAPEPSSGLLLLMGGAILALRRRRQK